MQLVCVVFLVKSSWYKMIIPYNGAKVAVVTEIWRSGEDQINILATMGKGDAF